METEKTEDKALAPIKANSRGLVLGSMDDMWRFASSVQRSGLAPTSFKTPEQILIAVQTGAEMGLSPMRSLQSLCVINGQARLYGDAPLALVRQSGLMEYIKERIEGAEREMVAHCTVKRKGEPDEQTKTFSVADAITAKLWGKAGPWVQYPKRMLQMRARALALRDIFPDAFSGATIAEEYEGVPGSLPEAEEPKTGVAGLKDRLAKPVESTVVEPEVPDEPIVDDTCRKPETEPEPEETNPMPEEIQNPPEPQPADSQESRDQAAEFAEKYQTEGGDQTVFPDNAEPETKPDGLPDAKEQQAILLRQAFASFQIEKFEHLPKGYHFDKMLWYKEAKRIGIPKTVADIKPLNDQIEPKPLIVKNEDILGMK